MTHKASTPTDTNRSEERIHNNTTDLQIYRTEVPFPSEDSTAKILVSKVEDVIVARDKKAKML